MKKIIDNICIAMERGDRSKMAIWLYLILGLISAGMTMLNAIQGKGVLTYVTGAFAILSFINIIFTKKKGLLENIATICFIIQIIGMFTIFLITGNPDGFSAIWICMLPAGSMFIYGRKYGLVICSIMFTILVFLLWIPFGHSFLRFDYGDTFCTRFPILFTAFVALAYFLASVTEVSLRRTIEARIRYKQLSTHDQLTGLYNRQGMYSVSKQLANNYSNLGVAILDIDFFKKVNDTYGHKAGDIVLKGISDYMTKHLDAILCRWGGEEFVAIYQQDNVTHAQIEQLRIGISRTNFLEKEHPDANPVTVCIGVCEPEIGADEDINIVIDKADFCLYHAKRTGRNKTVYYDDIS